MATAQELKSDYDAAFEIKRTGWERQLKQGMTDLDFFFRAQHTEEEASKAKDQNRELYTLDKIGRQVNLLHGYEIRNRHILQIGPQGKVDLQEDKACSQHSSVVMNLMTMNGGYDVLSEAFKWGPLIQGSNLIEIWRDRNGDLQFSRLGWNQFLLNPGLTRTDLTDCQDIAIGRWIDPDRIKFLLPANSDDLEAIQPLTNVSRWDFLLDPVLQNRAKRMLMEEWWRRETKFEEIVVSRVSGQEISLANFAAQFTNGDMRAAKRMVAETKLPNGVPAVSRFSRPNDIIKLTVFVNNRMVFDGLNPLKARDYNFVWLHGDWCAECPRDDIKLQSWSRKLRDPQRALNRRTNQIYDIIESQLQAFRVARSDKFINPEVFHQAGQGKVAHVDPNKDDGAMPLKEMFNQFSASEVPASLFQALEMTDRAETETGGLNQEIFGVDDSDADVPMVLARHRTGQALTGQAGLFQGFRNAKRELGRKIVRLVQLNYPPQKVSQIINEFPIPGFYEKNLTRFDCSPIEGLLTNSQQEQFFLLLMEMRAKFPNEANKIPLSAVAKYQPLFKAELIEIIQRAEQAEQQAQQEQRQQQAQNNQLQQAIAGLQVAQGVESMADAAEKRSEIPLNRVKTLVEAQKVQAEPLIAIIKEMVRLEIAREKVQNAQQPARTNA